MEFPTPNFPLSVRPRSGLLLWGAMLLATPGLAAEGATPDLAANSGESNPARSLSLEQLDAQIRKLAADVPLAAQVMAAVDAGHPLESPTALASSVDTDSRLTSDLALRVAAEFAAGRRYEPCLGWLEFVAPDDSSSPILYWHYRAVANHQLVSMVDAGDAAAEVLRFEQPGFRRVRELAELIGRDAANHKAGSIDHITHQMSDVERRLALGEPGEQNQELQQEVIDSLDKMIEQIEEQRKEQQKQQQQQQQIAQGGQGSSAQPMPDSRPGELKGPGEVDEREIPPGGDWGALPPAERERVAQQIIRDFPAHYRSVIEDYFRSLATSPDDQEGDR
ncbi:hypothetical protein Pla123a_26090 [Posidoniimonas polymericola]|uniref:Secreted protein n=1 Tax=Posidoniimonas polymericola TaxID=2528002 RepID=A0A5C5YLZ1_9BACT|nr:hypothetical protein [Posidoniimonas polymericola]TWT75827.1 hypothetical protein Pla123a_26090 [Posidoniimonas polymericola]